MKCDGCQLLTLNGMPIVGNTTSIMRSNIVEKL